MGEFLVHILVENEIFIFLNDFVIKRFTAVGRYIIRVLCTAILANSLVVYMRAVNTANSTNAINVIVSARYTAGYARTVSITVCADKTTDCTRTVSKTVLAKRAARSANAERVCRLQGFT